MAKCLFHNFIEEKFHFGTIERRDFTLPIAGMKV